MLGPGRPVAVVEAKKSGSLMSNFHKISAATESTTSKMLRVLMALIAVTTLAACGGGGGGGGGGSPSTPPDTEPDDVPEVPVPPVPEVPVPPAPVPPVPEVPVPPAPVPTVPTETRDFEYGKSAIEGISRIPKASVVLTPAEAMAVVITEPGNPGHIATVRKQFCDAYVEECPWDDDANVPFILLDGNDAPTPNSNGKRDYFIAEVNKRPNTLIISASVNPASSIAPRSLELEDQGIVFVIAAGNDGDPSYASHIASYEAEHDNGDGTTGRFIDAAGEVINPSDAFKTQFFHLRGLALADRLLVVGGWEETVPGTYSIAAQSNRCGILSDSCLYATFHSAGHGSGTSIAAPTVAAALASVHAVFTSTSGIELIKLAKACAIATDGLDGLGRADFTCMTVADPQGGWRLLTRDEFSALHSPSPGMMNTLNLPGNTVVSASFRRPGVEGAIMLATGSSWPV